MTELLDRVQISELYGRYNWAMDNSDAEEFVRTFHEDGVFIGTIGSFAGRDELREFCNKQNLKQRGVQHWNGNVVLNFEDEDTVHGKTYMLVLCQSQPGPVIERAGFYEDVVTREEGGWLFRTRRFIPLPGTASLAPAS